MGPDDGAVLDRVSDGVFDNAVVPSLASEFLNDRRHHLIVAIHEGLVVGMITAVDYVHPDNAAARRLYEDAGSVAEPFVLYSFDLEKLS